MYLNQKWNHYCYFCINICFLLLNNLSNALSSSHERSFAIHCTDAQCSNKRIILENSSCQYRGENDILNYFWITCNAISKRSINEKSIDDILADLKDIQYYELHPLKRVKRGLGTTFIDPLFKEQWYFNEEGNGGYDLNVKAAWAKGYTGKGVVVSILDDGIQKNHPDLFANYDPNASYDINDDDDDPMPRDNGDNKHGTRCAGEVAAMANNDYCGVGVAYEANIGGVRMLDGTVNDNVESKALGLKPNYIDIYSASWGPEDDGKTVDGPGPLARRQFIHGVTHGRNGKGSIFIWASGNGGRHNDSCNCDGYTNSIFTLSISSATQGGYKPWYLEECSSTLTTTYSSGTPGHDKSVTTVDMDSRLRKDHICTVEHTGTSASAPLAAGCAALALQANPDLTWRDMQYMVVLTSRAEPLMGESGWFKNGANRYVSHKFGYGLIDAGEMVNLAEVWIPVPPQHICKSPEVVSDRKIESAPFSSLELSMHVHGCNNSLNEVQYLEHVQCKITLRFFPRGNLRILLTSPAGTTSTLLFERTRDVISSNFDDWPFMSVHFWGERPHGRWKLSIQNTGIRQVNQNGILKKWQLIFYGTAVNPIRIKKSKFAFNNKQSVEYPQYTFGDFDPNFQFDSIYSGSNIEESIVRDQNKMTDVNCLNKNGCVKKCPKRGKHKENCVKECPNGTFEKSNNICVPCHDSCLKCTGPYQKDCLSCSISYFYLVDLKICMQHCPDGYYEDENERVCTPCTSNCGSCPDGPENCTRCHFNLVNHNNKCLASCPDNTYETDDNKCGLCHETCKTCSGPKSNQCFTCFPGTYELNNQCVKTCPELMFADNDTLECRPCAIGCRTCSSTANCLKCDKNWVHFNSIQCVPKSFKNCKQDEYLEESGTCKKCHASCKSCTSEDRQSCISCESPLLLQRSQCVNQCLDGYFLNDVNNICDICPDTCTKCTSLHTCSACKQSLVLQNNSCITSCHNGYYSDRGICTKCDVSCGTCSGPQFDQCISCPNNMYLVNGKCLEKCPKGFYKHSESMKCFKCDNLCPDCDKNDICFSDVDNNVNENNDDNEKDDILIKKETMDLEQQSQIKYVPLNTFSLADIYIMLILIVVIVILLIPVRLCMTKEYKSNSKRNLNSEIVYKVIKNSEENYIEDNLRNELDKKSLKF